MENVKIKKYSANGLNAIAHLCYKTGFMGEDLTGTGRFNDKILFSYLFCLYYPLYEMENCFVAIDDTKNKMIGYIIGSQNTIKQEKGFIIKMVPRIILRMCTKTIFLYPESFSAVLYFMKNLELKDIQKVVYKEYPAHLHMNILPEYQKKGVGSMLLQTFEEHMRHRKVDGIHIWTSNKNVKAVPFYNKHGYKILYEKDSAAWKGIAEYRNIIFGKKL